MIAIAKPTSSKRSAPAWHQQFLIMLPAIRRHAQIAFRHLDAEASEEAVQEVIRRPAGSRSPRRDWAPRSGGARVNCDPTPDDRGIRDRQLLSQGQVLDGQVDVRNKYGPETHQHRFQHAHGRALVHRGNR